MRNILKDLTVALLLFTGGSAATERTCSGNNPSCNTRLPKLDISHACSEHLDTFSKRVIAFSCMTHTLINLEKKMDHGFNEMTQRLHQASHGEPSDRLAAQIVKNDIYPSARNFKKSIKKINRMTAKKCSMWKANIPDDCHKEIESLFSNMKP